MDVIEPRKTRRVNKVPAAIVSAKRREAGRKGGNAKAGTKTVATIVKETEQLSINQIYLRGMRGVAQAQLALAKGLSFLYIIRTDKKGNRSKPELITSQATIEAYLADELDDEEGEYYFIATKEPNNEALKNIQDRVFGKPTENKVLDINHNFSLVGLAARRAPLHLSAPDVQVLPPPQAEEQAAE